MKLYVITGFLGAGKTTFLKQLAGLFSGQSLGIIVNEFGKEGIDGQLIQDLQAHIHEITGGSIFCSCRLDRFEAALEEMIAQHPRIILVEASGLSDPTGMRSILSAPRFAGVEYMGSICLADALTCPKALEMVRAARMQVAASHLLVLNKTDLCSREQLEQAREALRLHNPAATLVETSHGTITPSLRQALAIKQDTFPEEAWIKTQDITLKKALIHLSEEITLRQLEQIIGIIKEESYRIKGFVRIGDAIYLADCVRLTVQVAVYEGQPDLQLLQKLVVLSGKGLALGKAVRTARAMYGAAIQSVE